MAPMKTRATLPVRFQMDFALRSEASMILLLERDVVGTYIRSAKFKRPFTIPGCSLCTSSFEDSWHQTGQVKTKAHSLYKENSFLFLVLGLLAPFYSEVFGCSPPHWSADFRPPARLLAGLWSDYLTQKFFFFGIVCCFVQEKEKKNEFWASFFFSPEKRNSSRFSSFPSKNGDVFLIRWVDQAELRDIFTQNPT